MTLSKTTRLLSALLVLCAAVAASVWVFLVPRKHGMTEEHAHKLGYASARQRDEVYALDKSIYQTKRLTDDQAAQLAAYVKNPSATVRAHALVTLHWLTHGAINPQDKSKALDIILSDMNYPVAATRVSVVQDLDGVQDPRAVQAIQALTQDSDTQVRAYATKALENK